jgi:hypothetical protein
MHFMSYRFSRLLSSLVLVVLGIFIGWSISTLTRLETVPSAIHQQSKRSPLGHLDLPKRLPLAVESPANEFTITPDVPLITKDLPWRLRENLDTDLKKRLAELRKRLQSAEHARAIFATKETPETSAVKVEIKAATAQEQKRFWQEVNNEAVKLEPELRAFYEVDARRLLDQFLAFPKKHRVLVVVTHLPKEGGGYQEVHFVFNTDSPQDFVLSEDVVVTTPPSITLLNHITPWRDQVTQKPSERYGYLVQMESW